MQFSKISQVAHYAPEQVITNDDLSKIMDTSDEWISSRTGIRKRHISRNEDTSDLATEVAKQLIEKSKLSPTDIDLIIVATISPDASMPSTAAKVQANIGATNAFAYDLTAACSGFVFALSTADKFIRSGQYQKAIVIGAEVLSKTLDWNDRGTAVLFGDGAGGVLLEASDTQMIISESLHTDGSRCESLTSGQHGPQSPFSEEGKQDPYMKMDGRAIFDFAVRQVTSTIKEQLASENIPVDEIDYFFLHQANFRILQKMAKKLSVPIEKFPANMMKYGNTSAASIPILLSESEKNGTIKLDGSQTILMSGFGGGLTWGSLVVRI